MRKSMMLLSLLVAGCASVPRLVPPPVQTMDFITGRDFILTQPYLYSVGQSGMTIEVPQGFVTDYASIPPPLWSILSNQGRYSRAAVIHDFLYWSQTCTKPQADNLLMIAMKELGVRKRDRIAIYQGVHLGGQKAWNNNRQDREAGKPRIVPPDHYRLSAEHSWPQARAILIQQGVRDPQLPTSAPYCALGDTQSVP